MSRPQPVISKDGWRALRAKYAEIVGRAGCTTTNCTKIKETIPDDDGFKVRIAVKQDKVKGRTIVAAQPIKKGDRMYDDQHQEYLFEKSQDFRDFVFEVSIPCDILIWTYASEDGDGMTLNLDPGTYVNDGGSNMDPGTSGVINMQWGKATRDISPGEEVLEDYDLYDVNPATGKLWDLLEDQATGGDSWWLNG
jgi:hypothetical protein